MINTLERLGFKIAFGIPGMWSIPIYEALASSKIKHILVRHEQNAVFAADGYARSSGNIGLCFGSAGQGAINIASGIATPFRDHSPVLSITSHVPTYEQGKGWIEDIDLRAVFSPITKFFAQIEDPLKAYEILCNAYLSCIEGCPGPSHIVIPGDIQRKESIDLNYIPIPKKIIPKEKDVKVVIEKILNAKFPLILAGRGCILSNSSDLLLRFIESTGIPVVTSMMGRGIIPEDHPLCLGPVGRRGFEKANKALSQCDLLLVLGCRLTNMTISNIDLKCEIIQVDIEERNFSPIANIKVKSDISSFLERLNINKKFMINIEKSYGEDTIEYAKAIASFSDAIFTIDIGQHTIWILNAIIARNPRQIIFSGNMSSMGFSIPAAIGAKLANPNGRVISIVGDGGFQISSSELATIKENDITMVICLFNNRSLGLIRQIQEIVYGRTFGVDYSDSPDYLKLAEAYGINAIRVSNPKELIEVINKVKEPTLIEIPISKEEKVKITKPRILE